MDMSTEMKLIHVESHLNILDREITDFSGMWDRDPEATRQRFDDLIALVTSTKAILKSTKPEAQKDI